MSQRMIRRVQKTVTYVANGRQSESLSRGMLYRSLFLRLQGQLTLASANNTRAKTLRGDEWAAVTRIDIIANGSDYIRSFSGTELATLQRLYYRQTRRLQASLADAATTNPAIDSVLVLPFWSPTMFNPTDTLLDARRLSDLRVEITWGSHLSINADATGWTVAPAIQVSSEEVTNIDGSFSTGKIRRIVETPAGANDAYQIGLTVNTLLRGVLINSATSAGVDEPTRISNVKLVSGNYEYFNLPKKVCQEIFALQQFSPRMQYLSAAGVLPVPDGQSTSYDSDAWLFVDFCTGQLGYGFEMISAYGLSELNLELNVSGASTITVLPIEQIPAINPLN